MLSVKNLVKVYKTKGGTEVRALDGVTVDFPEKGMVFLLGRSGSGKSTLLNVAGGLDKPDSGEVIVKGKSSKDFSGSDFDSYRNTFVGFVFQEYNILNEFNIEQNIALALQLQGKKNDKAAVNAILKQVDLDGMGKRKPNTLSGGQKQRVAIARALIKEPEIIMADEPTGALDSNTGKQVLDTLKKLSETKLVIIVSHDREFAEQYGDRVIELKDGKILSDSSKAYAAPTSVSANVNAIGGDTVRVKDWSKLTQEEFNSIYTMLKGKGGEVIITSSESDMPAVKRACKITDDGSREYFKDTTPESVEIKSYDGSKTKFIKSRLPIGHAVKMGASGLKTKPIRLLFTILLSIISFTMFGVLSTMMMYDSVYSISEALRDTGYTTAVLQKSYDVTRNSYRVYRDGRKELDYSYDTYSTDRISEEELAAMNNNGNGIRFAGVYSADSSYSYENYLGNNQQSNSDNDTYTNFPSSEFSGFSDCGESFMTGNGFEKLAGKYPTEANEIAVSKYVYEQFKAKGYRAASGTVRIANYDDLIGKELNIFANYDYGSQSGNALKIVGIYDVGDFTKYNSVLRDDLDQNSKENEAVIAECNDELRYGMQSIAFVSDKFYGKYKSKFGSGQDKHIESKYMHGVRVSMAKNDRYNEPIDDYETSSYFSENTVRQNASVFTVYSTDGSIVNNANFSVGENEAYISLSYLYNIASILGHSSRQFDVFYDADGNTVYNARDGWTESEDNGFWTNYAGDVKFEETPGYGFVNGSESMYVHKNGTTAAYYEISNNMYDHRECFKTSESGEPMATVYPDDAHILVPGEGEYYEDGDGNYWLYDDKGDNSYQQRNGSYYVPRENPENKVYISIANDFYLSAGSYFVNNNDPTEIVSNRFENWRSVDGYYVDAAGNMSSLAKKGYSTMNHFYVNKETMDLSLEEKTGYEYCNSYYVDDAGNVSFDPVTDGRELRGLFINADGKLSLTKKSGYVFRNKWLYNSDTESVSLDKKYKNYYVNDATGEKKCDPAVDCSEYRAGVDISYREFNKDYGKAFKRLEAKTGYSGNNDSDAGELQAGDVALILNCIKDDMSEWRAEYADNDEIGIDKVYLRNRKSSEKELTVKGFYTTDVVGSDSGCIIISSSFASSFAVLPDDYEYDWEQEEIKNYVAPENLKYNYIIARSDKLADDVYFMLEDKDNFVYYRMRGNSVYSDAQTAIDMIETMSIIFLIVGLVMAALSALLLFNFISTSISAKSKEIGVLRAVGARGTDVFKIFFAEAFIIALICFVISAIAGGVICFMLNGVFAGAINLSVMNYGPLQILLILGISVVVALVATILPVFFAAKKPPVESIRAL